MKIDKELNKYLEKKILYQPFRTKAGQLYVEDWASLNCFKSIKYMPIKTLKKQINNGDLKEMIQSNNILYLSRNMYIWDVYELKAVIDSTVRQKLLRDYYVQEKDPRYITKQLEKLSISLQSISTSFKSSGILKLVNNISLILYQYAISFNHKNNLLKIDPMSIQGQKIASAELRESILWFIKNVSCPSLVGCNVIENNYLWLELQTDEFLHDYNERYFTLLSKAYKKYYDYRKYNRNSSKSRKLLRKFLKSDYIYTDVLFGFEENFFKYLNFPLRELSDSLLIYGANYLLDYYGYKNIAEKLGDSAKRYLTINKDTKTLYDALQIDRMAEELEISRKNDSELEVYRKERELMYRIQICVSQLEYDANGYSSSYILKNNKSNCVGGSFFGMALSRMAGFKTLTVHIRSHTTSLLLCSNGEIVWNDFLGPYLNSNLKFSEIDFTHNAKKYSSWEDVCNDELALETIGIHFIMKDKSKVIIHKWEDKYINQVEGVLYSDFYGLGNEYYSILHREDCNNHYPNSQKHKSYTISRSIINNYGLLLSDVHSEQCYLSWANGCVLNDYLRRKLIRHSGSCLIEKVYAISLLGYLHNFTNNYKESIKMRKYALSIKPDYPNALYGIACSNYALRKYKAALKYSSKSIVAEEREPESYEIHARILNKLKMYEEALLYYRKYLEESEDGGDPEFTKKAKRAIVSIQKKLNQKAVNG